jgi:acetylornithine deacetylase/succinyl-diaminopimelate desuccinylase-like protein
MSLQRVYEHIDEHVAMLQEYVRQPSVSVDGIGIRGCAELVAGYYRDLGCQEVERIETDGAPGIWAYSDASGVIGIRGCPCSDERWLLLVANLD